MSAFSDPNFDFKAYLENRPRYPDVLYDRVRNYHKGEWDTVLDLGCGPGLSLFPLGRNFKRIIGTDPSEGMIGEAQGAWKLWKDSQPDSSSINPKSEFRQDGAETLESIENQSVDMVIAATAAHWFDMKKVWPRLSEVVKTGGTVAFWCYGTNYLPDHPSLLPLMLEFMCSQTEKLGPYWPQPGRSLLENLLIDVPFPNDLDQPGWDDSSAARVTHRLAKRGIPDISWTEGKSKEETFRMEHNMSFESLDGYFHTSSASLRYFKSHPHLKEEKPDMISRHVNELREAVLQQRKEGGSNPEGLDDDHVRVAWPLGLMMIRKR